MDFSCRPSWKHLDFPCQSVSLAEMLPVSFNIPKLEAWCTMPCWSIAVDLILCKDKLSHLTITISFSVIVGVGSANFQQMDILDGDIVRLSANGVFAERDIVQFVPYRDHHSWMATICPEIAGKWSSSYDSTRRLAKVKLAQEVLAEIPEQLTGFMKSRGIIPKKRQPPTAITSSPNNATTPTSPVPSTSNGNPISKPNAVNNSS